MALRPPRPPSNFMVGVQRPKEAPAMEEAELEVELAAAAAGVGEVMTVAKVVAAAGGGAAQAAGGAEEEFVSAGGAGGAAGAAPEAAVLPEAPAAALGLPAVPARSLVVKLEKPLAAKTSATLRPAASNGVVRD